MMLPTTFAIPPALRRPLLCCAAALVAALCLWRIAAALCAVQETAVTAARTAARNLEIRLTRAREAEAEHTALTRRFTALAAMAGHSPGNDTWEQITHRLRDESRITGLVLHAEAHSPALPTPAGLPALDIQRLQIDAGLLHEEALLALEAIVADTPAHIVPTGCALRRESGSTLSALHARCEFDWIALTPTVEETVQP
ncbi:MAG: hypothetical protein LBT71_05310 [Azoarcus sp.]|jgi:hypothetical protein|nr:hypothetical protein [Azoarcus sp.]